MKNVLKFVKFAACALLASVVAKAVVLPGLVQPTSIPFNNAQLLQFQIPAVSQGYNPAAFLVRGDGANVFGVDLAAVFNNSGVGMFVTNAATAAQAPVATTRTYITGSQLAIPSIGLQVGTILRWHFEMVKTAAGTATSTIDIAFGTAGTTADTAQVSFTKPAGVAAIDDGFVDVEAIVKAIGGSGVVVGEIRMVVNNTGGSGGHLASGKYAYTQSTTSSSFTISPSAVTYVGLCITTGASDAITINQCSAEAINP